VFLTWVDLGRQIAELTGLLAAEQERLSRLEITRETMVEIVVGTGGGGAAGPLIDNGDFDTYWPFHLARDYCPTGYRRAHKEPSVHAKPSRAPSNPQVTPAREWTRPIPDAARRCCSQGRSE
jgi:hypothetical protein